MMEKHEVVPFEKRHITAAMDLFIASYHQEQRSSPLLPPLAPSLQALIQKQLHDTLQYPCVAICNGDRLLGYTCTCAQFDFKGQRAAIVREYAHGSVSEDKALLYQQLYAALGQHWVSRGIHFHALCHFAGDRVLRETLFQLGFGGLVAEQLRNLADIPTPAAVEIVPEDDVESLIPLTIEHMRYYRPSPIFLIKDDAEQAVRAQLQEYRRRGDVLLVYRERGEPFACFVVGRSTGNEEGFLLQGTDTAQILSAYARPDARQRGIGKALLQRSIEWARAQGFERLLVEHETANIDGGNFWRRHFSPFLYCSTRYVDCTL